MKLGDIVKPNTPILEAGAYLAVCVGVAAIGEQYIPPFGDKKTGRYENRVLFIWDVPSEPDENGAPKQLSKAVNATVSEKGTMMAILSGWNSRAYSKEELAGVDLYDQIGKPCMLTVSVSESGYSNVSAVSAIPKGIPAPTSKTPIIKFDVNEWSDEGFAALPEWMQDKIKNSTEYQKLHTPETTVDFPEEAVGEGLAPPAGTQTAPLSTGGSRPAPTSDREVNPI